MKKEPALIVSAVTAVVESIIAAAVAFGLDWTPEQIAAVLGVVGAVGALATGIITRKFVVPTHKKMIITNG